MTEHGSFDWTAKLSISVVFLEEEVFKFDRNVDRVSDFQMEKGSSFQREADVEEKHQCPKVFSLAVEIVSSEL